MYQIKKKLYKMKPILFITLFVLTFYKTTEESNNIISFYKCLLLDSDTVYNHINSLVEAIITLDPVKLVESFTTIYPAIVTEVKRCKNEVETKADDFIVLKNSNTEGDIKVEFFKALLKVVTTYIMPFLNPLGFDLKKICNKAFPDVFICELL